MRVALYTGTFQRDQDGVAKTIYRLVDTIVEKGMDLAVWSPLITEGADRGFQLHRVASLSLPLYKDYRIGIPKGIKRELDEFKPDVIHIATPDIVGRYFLRYGRKKGIPVVASYHTDFSSYLKYYHLTFLRGALWKYLKWFHNGCRATFAPTREVKKGLENRGIKEIHIWSRGIDTSQYGLERRSRKLRKDWGMEGRTVILYSGRFVWYKDIDVFVDVYRKLKSKYKDEVGFVLIGSGPREGDLKKSIPEGVFPGYLTGEELWSAYASSDILLFPSVTETFGNVVLEAVASGVPAVVSDVGGCMEIVEDTGGGLVATAKDTDAFYRAVSRLLDDKTLYKKIRSMGLDSCSKRDWTGVNKKVLDTYIKLVR
ncbi:MAG: glycosyltransferase family 1 protein [Thermoplasmata archaeon]|nr:glycosyltransferase family 1 protein [Thermoplasmata archaeon]